MGKLSCVDEHPVYIDSLGQPLSYGKLTFKTINTSTLATVYTDLARSIPSANPVILDIAGRTPTQIFYADAQYDVYAEKFNGIDPNVAPPEDWYADNQWIVDGTLSASTASSYFTVDTITALRSVNPAINPTVSVLGYYAKGDCFVRNYLWTVGGSAVDNGGVWIAHTGDSTGVWELQNVGDTMDVRSWGILPGRVANNNSQMSAMAAFMSTAINLSAVIFFPRGIYQVNSGSVVFYNTVQFDVGTSFKSTVGAYTMGFGSYLINPNNGSFMSSGSSGAIIPDFFNDISQEVRVAWWTGYGVDITSATWAQMIAHISNKYTIVASKQALGHNFVNTTDITLTHKVRFERGAYIALNSGAGKLVLNYGTSIICEPGYGCFRGEYFGGGITKLALSGIDHIRTSWFLPGTDLDVISSTTNDLGKILTDLQTSASDLCKVIYDAPDSMFNTEFYDGAIFRHEFEFGTLRTSFPIDATYGVRLKSLSNWGKGCMSGAFVIAEDVTHFTAFYRSGSHNTAYNQAFNSAYRGGGVLDLDGAYVNITAAVGVNGGIGAVTTNFTMRNGSVSSANGSNIIYITGGGGVTLFTISNCQLSTTGMGTIVWNGGAYITKFNVINSEINAFGGYGFVMDISATMTECNITNSIISVNELCYQQQNTTWFLTGNTINVISDINMSVGTTIATNNVFTSGTSGIVYAGGYEALLVNGNYFKNIRLYLESDSSSKWSGSACNNAFNGSYTNTGIRFIALNSSQTGMFYGITVSNNSFTLYNVSPTSFNLIDIHSGSVQSTSPTYKHRVVIANNTINDGSNAHCPATTGTFTLYGFRTNPMVNGQLSVDLTYFGNARQVFFIEGCTRPLFTTGGLLTNDTLVLTPATANYIEAARFDPIATGVYLYNYSSNGAYAYGDPILVVINATIYGDNN